MKSKVIMLLVAAAFIAPTAMAAWSAKGAWEPDTTFDKNGGFMFQGPDTTPTNSVPPVRKVYFNGIMGQEIGYFPYSQGTSLNPNFATLQTSHSAFPLRPRALLGVWKDCNRDNYVGYGDNALFEYRVELLPDTNTCKPTPVPTPLPIGTFPPHNDGTWVHEFIPIGYDNRLVGGSASLDLNRWNVNDWGSRMWVDDGVPGSPPSGTCYTTAHPPGTYHSVGGLANFSDCYLSGRVEQTGSNLGSTWTTLKQVRNPWGEESDASYVGAWDCSQPQLTNQKVGTTNLNVSRPRAPPTVGTSGSAAGTLNATGAGFDECNRTPREDGPMHTGNTLATAPYQTESDVVNNQRTHRVEPEFVMSYSERTRASGTPPDQVGLGDPVYSQGHWCCGGVRAVSRNPYVDRTLIAPQKVSIFSFYAKVSPGAITSYGLTLAKTGVGVYGSGPCVLGIGAGQPIRNGWACDPAAWYPNGPQSIPRDVSMGPGPDGAGVIIAPFVGEEYNLLDVDCYDESVTTVRNTGAHYGVLTGTNCFRP